MSMTKYVQSILIIIPFIFSSCSDSVTGSAEPPTPEELEERKEIIQEERRKIEITERRQKAYKKIKERRTRSYPLLQGMPNSADILNYLESGNFITFPMSSERYNYFEEKFLSEKNLNHQTWPKGVREIKITGLEIILSPGHPNGFYERLHQKRDIKRLIIEAKKLIIKGNLELPQTELRIDVENLTFTSNGALNTTPRPRPGQGANRKQGRQGLHASAIFLKADQVHVPNNQARIIARGGRGQRGGPGENGAKGESVKALRDNIIFECQEPITPHRDDGRGNIIILYHSPKIARGLASSDARNTRANRPIINSLSRCQSTRGINRSPGDGYDAIPGGLPGLPGNSARVYTNLSTSLFDLSPGAVGQRAEEARGGAPGRPFPAIAIIQHCPILGGHTSRKNVSGRQGRSAPGPKFRGDLSGHRGRISQIREQGQDQREWSKILARYIRDHYRFGHHQSTYFLVNKYQNDFQDDLLKTQNSLLKERLELGIDYFNESFFSVPLLSLEKMVQFFERDTKRDLEQLTSLRKLRDRSLLKLGERAFIQNKQEEEWNSLEREYEKLSDLVVKSEKYEKQLEEIEVSKRNFEREFKNYARRVKNSDRVYILKSLLALARVIPFSEDSLLPILDSFENVYQQVSSAEENRILHLLEYGAPFILELNDFNLRDVFEEMRERAIAFSPSHFRDLSTRARISALENLNHEFTPFIQEGYQFYRNIASRFISHSEIVSKKSELLMRDPKLEDVLAAIENLQSSQVYFQREMASSALKIQESKEKIVEILSALQSYDESVGAVLNKKTLKALDRWEDRILDGLIYKRRLLNKSFYFNQLRKFEDGLDFSLLLKELDNLIKKSPAGRDLDINSLLAIYQSPFSNLFDEMVLSSRMTTRDQVSGFIRLKSHDLVLLKHDTPLYFDLADFNIFEEESPNPRLVKIEFENIVGDTYAHLQQDDYLEITVSHIGYSDFQFGAHKFIHQREQNPFHWSVRYYPMRKEVLSIKRHENFKNILASFVEDRRSPLYLLPSARADLKVSVTGPLARDQDFFVEELELKITIELER